MPRCGRTTRGFTLIETLVAIGAVALLAVAIAAVFEATGRTVSAGRRVSTFQQAAAQLEQQLRRDVSRMTRDGFMVIRNEFAATADNATVANRVPGFDGDTRPRARRTDELMFFATGDFATVREPIAGQTARSRVARIYYGHGQRWSEPPQFDSIREPYFRPTANDTGWPIPTGANSEALGDQQNPDNPNRFASEWALLRHVTLLAVPSVSESIPGGGNVVSGSPGDTDFQIRRQPAATSIFRTIAAKLPTSFNPVSVVGQYPGPGWRTFAGGIVDIATTDLSEIRAFVTTVGEIPDNVNSESQLYNPSTGAGLLDGQFTPTITPGTGDLAFMQTWMRDALPSRTEASDWRQRRRVRWEPGPTNLLGVMTEQPPGSGRYSPDPEIRRAYWLADQLALSASTFAPRCTEFIVEWSFGKVDTDTSSPAYGQLIWHGMDRPNPDSSAPNDRRTFFARVYTGSDAAAALRLPSRLSGTANPVEPLATAHLVRSDLIHGLPPNQPPRRPQGEPIFSFFGYMDPTYTPVRPTGASVKPSMPWAWPKLLRITLTLADQSDPTVEETFQFVFQVPQGTES